MARFSLRTTDGGRRRLERLHARAELGDRAQRRRQRFVVSETAEHEIRREGSSVDDE
jgi:hypothetical protein